MSDQPNYIEYMSLTFKDETPADKVVAISVAQATYNHCTVHIHWHRKMTNVDEHTDMLALLRELQEWDS